MTSNYIICATPRSGSNMLCEVLSSLGSVGHPDEHLWVPSGTDSEPLAARWPQVLVAGCGANGVFGTKLMWYQAERLERELPEALGMSGQSLATVLAAVLDSPKYIYLSRRDHLRQAISLIRAIQSGQWRSMDHASGPVQYDPAAITCEMDFLTRDETNWESFFARQSLSPYRLTYEDLESSLDGAIARVLAHLGHPGPIPALPAPRHQRQADELTELWVRRYACHRLSDLNE